MGTEEAHAPRAAQFVGRTHQGIGPQGSHRLDRIEAAQGVADAHQAHQLGALIEIGLQILQIQARRSR